MNKISIAFYSTFKKPGWKSEQFEDLVPKLEKQGMLEFGYGIKTFKKIDDKNLKLSTIPLIMARLVDKMNRFDFIHDYYGYLIGEYITGLIFKRHISLDKSNVVYLKPRPFCLVEECNKRGKKIVLEFGEMHPLDTKERLIADYIEFDCSKEYIFTSDYAINEALKSIELADVILVLSEESKKSFIRNGVDENKIKVINLGLNQKSNNIFDNDKEYAFLSTAKHSLVKGTHRLLLAWRKANILNMKLYLVGELSEDIKEFINKNGPFDNVVYLGKKNIHEIYPKYNFVGILNSLSEGYGRSVIEYLGYGFPCIVTEVATCDIIKNGEQGFIINNEDELIDSLLFFSENIIKYEEFSISAKNAAEDTLNDNFSDELIELFKGL